MQSEFSLKKRLYSYYKEHLSESRFFINTGHWWELSLRPMLMGKRSERYSAPQWRHTAEKKPLSSLKLAVICDEMTWCNLEGECELLHLTPQNWRSQLEQFRPDAFFCESAWEGNSACESGWRWKIYRNHELWFENRKELLNILRYCKVANIPTLFWNKEDPPAFSGQKYDFIDTALRFDHIFTTAEECVKNYTDAGHKSVHTLMFGFSPRIFHPQPYTETESAVFHGSWYEIHPQRCEDMRHVFDMLLDMDIPLTIYDRQSGAGNPLAVFPDKYKPFVHPSVPYDRIVETLSGQSYAVNINTITDSATMFARRVFEMMACGLIVISNRSVGIERFFGSRVWFSDANFDRSRRKEIRRENIADVFLHHTWRRRMISMLCAADIEVSGYGAETAVIYRSGSIKECEKHFKMHAPDGASGWLLSGSEYISLNNGQTKTSEYLEENTKYFIAANTEKDLSQAEFMLSLTGFIKPEAAVAVLGGEFDYIVEKAGENWLIPITYLKKWEAEPNIRIEVYRI